MQPINIPETVLFQPATINMAGQAVRSFIPGKVIKDRKGHTYVPTRSGVLRACYFDEKGEVKMLTRSRKGHKAAKRDRKRIMRFIKSQIPSTLPANA